MRLAVPPLCHGCGKLLAEEDVLCPKCRSMLRRVEGILCVRCGKPFASPEGPEHTCAFCMENTIYFETARSAFFYEDVVMNMIKMVKFQNRYATVRALVSIVPRPGQALDPSGYDVATSVPMTNVRLRKRMANPGHMIAKGLAAKWGMPYEPDLLDKVKETPLQRTLTAVERLKNMEGAFRSDPARTRGRAVLLLDDIYTTGATANACARALKRAGAHTVGVYTVARTADR